MDIFSNFGNMSYTDRGSGDVILFLHGYLSNKESFNSIINNLEKKFRCIAIDFLGFGESEELKREFSLDDYVQSIIEFLELLKIERVNILAHSFGARVAIKLACNTQIVDKLILTGAAGLKPKRKLAYFIKVYTYKLLKKINPKLKVLNKFGSSDYKKLNPIMQKSFIKIVNEHLDDYLCNVKRKTLLIFGEKDNETPLYMAKKMKNGIEKSELVIFKNASHFAFVDESYKFAIITKEFLLIN